MKNEKKKSKSFVNHHISWSDLNLHQVMIQDTKRTKAYQKAIKRNIKKNDIVLDAGCGLGILSFFAAQTQCQKVYSVDNSDIIHQAQAIAKVNRLSDRIHFIKKDILKFHPKEMIDVLIHEQIGGFLWDEGFVKKIAHLREQYLRKNGKIIPSKIELFFVPTSAQSNFDESMAFWSRKQYGIDFNTITQDLFMRHAKKAFFPSTIELNSNKTFLGIPKKVYTVDFYKEKNVPSTITANFLINKEGLFRGVCGFFKIYLDEKTVLTSEPQRKNTHWGQIFLPNIQMEKVQKGARCAMTLSPHEDPLKWKFEFKIN